MMSLPPFDHRNQPKFTASPNSAWSFCRKVDSTPEGRAWLKGEKQGWKTINTAQQDPLCLLKLMNSGIVPRPIAFVATISDDGVENLAPYSWFNMVSNWPPIVAFTCAHTPRVQDTAVNVKNGNGFTVNIISEPCIENADVTSIDAPPKFDEWLISGLTKVSSVHVKASRIKESAFSMECDLFQAIDIVHPTTGECTATHILAHVKYIHVRNDVLNERGRVDIAKFKPVCRLGDVSYGRVGDVFRIPHSTWATEEREIQEAVQRL